MDRCALCPGVNPVLPMDGPYESDTLFIGEAPGFNENRQGRVFVGRSGEEVNRHYLPLAGLRREAVAFTNAIRCFPTTSGGKLDPNRRQDVALLECCTAHHLTPLLERLRPTTIVPLGAFACRAVGVQGTLDYEHGIPQPFMASGWASVIFPMYHPALGIYEPKKMLMIRTDWQRLRQHLKGTLYVPHDDYPKTDYREACESDVAPGGLEPLLPLACDTESRRTRQPYCLTYSQYPGTGRLIRADRPDLLARFQHALRTWRGPILFHNWLYDWPVTEHLGLRFPHSRVVDTMACVYHLGNLPQGLKALAYRELGMVMDDFEDVVLPYSTQNVLNYYEIARTVEWPKPDPELVIDDKTGLWKLYKPQSITTKLKRFFTDYSKKPEKDVFQTWENWEAHQSQIEVECGPWPGMCISHVPFEKVLHYACRDADALIRLWPLLQHMKSRVREVSQEHWRRI